MALIIKRINVSEIDLTEYENFAAKCKGQINIGAQNSLNLAIEAANVAAKLAEYKTLLSFTSAELEREAKLLYSKAFMNASKIEPSATSDVKREAIARQDTTYIEKVTERSKINAMLDYVTECLDHVTKLHYIFKAAYLTEIKIPSNMFQQF